MNRTIERNRGCASRLGWILLVVGLFFLGALLWNQVRVAVFGKVTEGVVAKVTTRVSYGTTTRRPGESMESYRDRAGGGVSHDLHVRYTSADTGEPVEFETVSTFGHDLKEGDEVPVIYVPGKPQSAEIYSAKQLWLPMVTGTLVTALCLGGGIFLRRAVGKLDREG